MLEEGICDHRHQRMTVKALPGSSLEVIETEFFFQLLVSGPPPQPTASHAPRHPRTHRSTTTAAMSALPKMDLQPAAACDRSTSPGPSAVGGTPTILRPKMLSRSRTLPAGFIQPVPMNALKAALRRAVAARDQTRWLPGRSRSCIIDGEAVACDERGIAAFDRIRYRRNDDCVFLYAFDLIELNGDDLRRDPLVVRKATLASVLAKAAPGIRLGAGP